jgi:outer membrane protein assembly factor BamB
VEFLRWFAGALFTGCLVITSCGPPEPLKFEIDRAYCSWESSGGDPGRTSHVNHPTPDQPRLLWSIEFKPSLYMQPVAAYGFLLIPAIDKRVYVISANNGSSVAEIRFRDVILAPLALADSTVAINVGGDKLVVGNWVNRILDWQAELDGSPLEPVIFDHLIYWLDGGDYLRCFDLKEGKRVWDEKLTGRYFAPPTVSSEGLVVAAFDGRIECFDPFSGKRNWELKCQGRFENPPVIIEDYLFVVSTSGRVEKIGLKNGIRIWESDLRCPVYAPLATDGQGVFVGTNNRLAIRLDSSSGRITWEENIGGPIKAGPVITGDLAIFVSIDHNAYFMDKTSGEIRHVFETQGMLTSRPVVCDDRVIIAGEDNHLYCIQISKDE